MINIKMIDLKELLLMVIESIAVVILYNSFDKKKRTILKNISAIFLIVIVEVMELAISPNINLFINFSLMVVVFTIAFNEKIDEAILKFSLNVILGTFLQLILLVILLAFKIPFNANDPKYFVMDLILNVVTLVMIIGVYRYIPVEKVYLTYNRQIRKIYILVINVVFFTLTLRTLIDINRSYFMGHIVYFAVMPVVIIIVNLTFYFYNLKAREEKKAKETYNAYSPIMSNLIDDVRRRQHDFRNHLTTIYGLVQVTEDNQLKDKLKNYIKSLTYSLDDYSYLIEVNNKVVAAIIYNKIYEAKDKGITFLYEIYGDAEIPLQDFELSEILNNLLDNAFRAALDADTENKEVSLEIGSEEGIDFVEVRNSVHKDSIKNIDKFSDKGFTTKKSGGHGYGLYNVKRIAEQYDGKVRISADEKYITIKTEFERSLAYSAEKCEAEYKRACEET